MQLVLLSGGSGKRLWPLSNNARSKQFLRLLSVGNRFSKDFGTQALDCPKVSLESMVQRVVRQISEAGLTSCITLATNASQLDIITNQLGDRINVVTEPERRDTFPAIALTASYLSLEKQCTEDEVVVVMPCDPYTETSYFHTIARMVECIEANVASIVLMGITPTYPSEKYGYVVPTSEELNISASECYKVAYFTEKPTVGMAKKLLMQNALWNGGVFAFRLGYIMSIVRKYIQPSSFADLRVRYSELPKISFDYEVIEKSKSVAVVPFRGKWRDIGTWNSLTDVLCHNTFGNASLGPNCHNTHVINELHHPIFVDGVSDLVIAASPDGILVCNKSTAEDIKKYINPLPSRPMYEERRWGTSRVLDDTIYEDCNHALTKSVTLIAGKSISYQVHHLRRKAWTIVEGEALFVLNGKECHVKSGDVLTINAGEWHAIKALSKLTFIEVQVGDPLDEGDILRKDWVWSK